MEHPRSPSAHRDTPDPEAGADTLSRHRATVVRRLLERGIRTQTLAALLPGWEHLLAEVEQAVAGDDGAPPTITAASATRTALAPPRPRSER